MRSLTHRKRFTEAIDLGLESLHECGIIMPAADRLDQELDHQYEYLYRWLDTDAADDLARPEITDPTLLAATRLIDAILPAGYFVADHATHAWLSLEALRIWIEHGPGQTLLGPACFASFHAVAQRGDSVAGYRALQRLLAVGEARGYEPETSQARFVFAILSCWFEPIENGLHAALRAREGLIAGGELAYAGYTYNPTAYYLLDCAPTLDHLVDQVEAGARLRTAHRQRTDSARCSTVTGGWPACCAAKARTRSVRRIPPTGTPTTRSRFSTRISTGRSPPPSSAIRSTWRDTPQRRCRCYRLPWASTRPPWPTCCAGSPSPSRPAPATVTSAPLCCPNWMR